METWMEWLRRESKGGLQNLISEKFCPNEGQRESLLIEEITQKVCVLTGMI